MFKLCEVAKGLLHRNSRKRALLVVLVNVLLVTANVLVLLHLRFASSNHLYRSATLDKSATATLDNSTTTTTLDKSATATTPKMKLILGYNVIGGTQFSHYYGSFAGCTNKCQWTNDKSDYNRSDAVIFHLYRHQVGKTRDRTFVIDDLPKRHSQDQKWIFVAREPSAVYYPQQLKLLNNTFNLSMTYQLDSDITIAYGTSSRQLSTATEKMKRMEIKKRNVLWLVGNCKTSSRREDYVIELQKYINVDALGRCSLNKRKSDTSRVELAKEYNFYLAFENSDCDDYVTEKFWDSLSSGLIPIVRGKRVNYKKIAPPNSFIHADEFEDPEHLARTLRAIASNQTSFLKYHEWRANFTVIKDTKLRGSVACNICDQAHTSPRKTVDVYKHFSDDKRCYRLDPNKDRIGEGMIDIVDTSPIRT